MANDALALDLSPHIMAQLQRLLKAHVPQAEVWAYGSRVRGTAHETSDLDLVLRYIADPNAEVPGWADLKEAVQQSTIPILIDIHLWPHLPPRFHAEIDRAHVVVQR